MAAVTAMGGVPVDLGIVKDKEATLRGAVEAALEGCDLLVTSGGVSMGEADLLKPILEVRRVVVCDAPACLPACLRAGCFVACLRHFPYVRRCWRFWGVARCGFPLLCCIESCVSGKGCSCSSGLVC